MTQIFLRCSSQKNLLPSCIINHLLQYMAFMLCTGLVDFLALAVFNPLAVIVFLWSSTDGKVSYTIGIPPCNFSAVDRSEPEWERKSCYSYLYVLDSYWSHHHILFFQLWRRRSKTKTLDSASRGKILPFYVFFVELDLLDKECANMSIQNSHKAKHFLV